MLTPWIFIWVMNHWAARPFMCPVIIMIAFVWMALSSSMSRLRSAIHVSCSRKKVLRSFLSPSQLCGSGILTFFSLFRNAFNLWVPGFSVFWGVAFVEPQGGQGSIAPCHVVMPTFVFVGLSLCFVV